MKYVQILILLCGVSLSAAEPETEAEKTRRAASDEKAMLEEMSALWEKIGPHAKEGSKHAKDNRVMFDAYYRQLANSLASAIEDKTNQAPRPSVAE